MKRLFLLSLLALTVLVLPAQQKRTGTKAKTTAQTRKTSTARKTTASKTKAKKAPAKKTTTKKKTTAKKDAYSNASIRGLQKQRSQIQQKIKQQEKALRANQADVKKRLQNLMVINTEIGERQKNINNIQKDITHIESNMDILKAQLETLEKQLNERKTRYIKSMRFVTRQHTFQDRLMFILSAHDFSQMYRRMRFVREYAAYQRVQGEAVKAKQAQVDEKHRQLETVRGHKSNLLAKGEQERKVLEGRQTEQKNVVASLQKQQKTIQQVIAQQRKKDEQLNAEIDRQIAIEVEKARRRAAEEARKKAQAEAARKRAEELARKKAQAEAEARENARRIAEAKAREQRLKEAAEQASAKQRARAEQAAREAVADREAAERKAEADARRNKKEIESVGEDVQEMSLMTSVDRKLSGSFEANRGRLPMPITGGYRVVSHFGQYNVEGLKGVKLDNKGINILGQPGARARSIYDGEVSAVFGFSGSMVVMVRHGSYISVYCNLSSVSVSRGQKVSTRQALGTVGRDNILQFQLRHNMSKLNPESWLGR
ncbi:MAG: peptidoglycan DD-metalloendopeptidase family protein [Prevotella sp.]|nr:peptidoglycan DD-metalloendopeptidase family protein [Prevotella sp.]